MNAALHYLEEITCSYFPAPAHCLILTFQNNFNSNLKPGLGWVLRPEWKKSKSKNQQHQDNSATTEKPS